MDLPLVSCTMPTADRRQFIPGAVGYFLAQTSWWHRVSVGDLPGKVTL